MTSLFGQDTQRILAVWFPYLATERIWRQRLGRSWRSTRPASAPPLVVCWHENNAQRIAALDARAERLELRCGMGIADARAMHPALDVVEADDEADRRLLEALADWCDRYTPLVAFSGDDGLFLDITGCAHLFGGETAMLDDLVRRLSAQGFAASAGLASTAGAAWAAARYRLPPVAAGAEQDALAPLPLAALRVGQDICGRLESVGLRTVGAIVAAPRAPLARRFGRTLLTRLDQALGRLDEAISPHRPAPPLSVERQLAEPLSMVNDIERLLLVLAGTLKLDLERRGEGARRLQLALFRVDGVVSRIDIGASRPLREPALIVRLFHERLAALEGGIDAGYGFDLVRLAVLAADLFDASQGELAGNPTAPDEDLALFVDRVRARLGERVRQPTIVGSHVPERAVTMAPATAPARRGPAAAPAARERPLRLFARPEPVEVTAEIPEGPPANFRWRRARYRVAGAEGPERIAPEWWQDDNGAETRDYYRVEDADGRRFWLYREGFYGAATAPRWFVHGVFA